MNKTPDMRAIEGGRKQREQELLSEMMKPGIDNLDKVRAMGDALAPRGKLESVKTAGKQAKEEALQK